MFDFIKKIFKKKPTPISFKDAVELTGLPIVTFYQGNHKLHFILDTGATNNIIDKSVIEKLDYTIAEGVESSLMGLEGNASNAQVCKISMYYQEVAFPAPYLIVDMSSVFKAIKEETGVTLHGLIGSNFFRKYQYVIDFEKLIAYSKKW